jgi:hypothetical protein
MDDFNYKRASEFCFEGRFLGLASNASGKLKYIRLEVETNELQIKLPKQMRIALLRGLQPGDQVVVFGKQKIDKYTGQFKLKAYQVNKLNAEAQPEMSSEQTLSSRQKVKILMCQKSGCLKRGGKKLCQQLEAILRDRGLQDQVKIERTSCLKKCSQAPNVVLMPGKQRLSGMHPETIAALVENL